MKRQVRNLIYSILGIGIAIAIMTSCKKDSTVTAIQYGSLSDFEGNVYTTINIGSQTWMAENLKATKFNDGTAIPLVKDNILWSKLTTPGHCFYANDSTATRYNFGALYNWYTVQSNKLCPTGWHVPSDADWTALKLQLGVDSIAGGKLKTTGYVNWSNPNTAATNSTNFNAMPFGYRYYNGTFNNFGFSGTWWSSTQYTTSTAWYCYLAYNQGTVGRTFNDKLFGMSVRCLKN